MNDRSGSNWLRSPFLEILVMSGVVLLSHAALLLITWGADVPPGGMAPVRIAWLIFGFFLLSFSIAVIAVIAGIGGGVIYTPILLAFTPVNSLVVRATGLIVAMFSGLISTGPFMKSGMGNLKLSLYCCLGYSLGALAGAHGAVWVGGHMGATGDGAVRLALGLLVLALAIYFLLGGAKVEWPEVARADRFTRWLGLERPYFEKTLGRIVSYRVQRAAWGLGLMLLIGGLSGFFGLGAGWALVPSLNLVMGVPMKVAAASSGILIGMGDCVAVWPYLLTGAIIPLFAAPWLVGQVVGGILGAHVLAAIRAGSVRLMLIGITIFSAFGLIVKGLTALNAIAAVPGFVHVVVLLAIMAWVAWRLFARDAATVASATPAPAAAGPQVEALPEEAIHAAAERTYGRVIYAVVLVAAAICVAGPVLAVAAPANNILNPYYLFGAIWKGLTPEAVWLSAGNGFPGGHFWSGNLTLGDGLTQFGLALGSACVGLALIPTAVVFAFHRPRSRRWALLCLVAAALVWLSAVGICGG